MLSTSMSMAITHQTNVGRVRWSMMEHSVDPSPIETIMTHNYCAYNYIFVNIDRAAQLKVVDLIQHGLLNRQL